MNKWERSFIIQHFEKCLDRDTLTSKNICAVLDDYGFLREEAEHLRGFVAGFLAGYRCPASTLFSRPGKNKGVSLNGID
jgi:hypothetical protein